MIRFNTVLNLRVRYIIGLSVIALLVTASFFTIQRLVSEQRNFSTLINLAGHQAGLVDRLINFATVMAATHDASEFGMARGQVGRAINQIRLTHEILLHGDADRGIPKVHNNNLDSIYNELGLNQALANFLQNADFIYDSKMESFTIKSPVYIYVATYGPHILEPLLNAVVDEYDTVGKAAIRKIERFEKIIWLAAIITLVLELIFIFIPLDRHIRKSLSTLESSIKNLTNTRKRLLSAQKMAMIGDWELKIKERILSCSEQIYEIFGISQESFCMTVKSALQLIHPEDRAMVGLALISLIRTKQPSKIEYRVVRPDGTVRLVYQFTAFKQDESDGTVFLTGTIQDITERKELSMRLEKLSAHIPGFLFQYYLDSNGHSWIPYASNGFLETCGMLPEQVHNNTIPLLELLHAEDIDQFHNTLIESSKKLTTWHAQYRIRHPHKGHIWLEGHATPERLVDGGTRWHGYIWDITERRYAEDRIRRLALYDPLTGLANRRLLKDRLSHAIAMSHRNSHCGAVIMLDLDNFKILNDSKGHEIGDALLVEVAKRLHNCVREIDTVARLGGDEFVIILESLGTDIDIARNKVMVVAEKIRVALSNTYYFGDGQHVHRGSASIGVTLFLSDSKDESELLKRADVAMYEAKERGRNCVCLYNHERQAAINSKNSLAQNLLKAMEQDEFSLYLQPQITKGGKLYGAEALLRWLPPGRDPIPPSVFIPVAENNGMIIQIGEWVLKRACQHLIGLSEYDLPRNFSLAVNISARQFGDNAFFDKMKTIIIDSGINIQNLKFELTESCFVQDLERGQNILTKLRNLGLTIELDDFGTGYSSLKLLNSLPINALKIDRSFIHGIDAENSTKAIIMAILAMAKAMDLKVVAEGVETLEQSIFLVNEGCDVMQGYLYSHPLPYDAFVEYIQNYRTKPSPPATKYYGPLPAWLKQDDQQWLN